MGKFFNIQYVKSGVEINKTESLQEVINNEDFAIICTDTENIKITIRPKLKLKLISFQIILSIEYDNIHKVFCNGLQSWSESREFSIDDSMNPLNSLIYPNMSYQGDYYFTDYSNDKGMLHSISYTYLSSEKNCDFYGSLNERTGYTIFYHNTLQGNMHIKKDLCGISIEEPYELLNVIHLNGEYDKVFQCYFQCLDLKPKNRKVYTGWTSWYNYYNNINEQQVMENIEAFRDIPIDVIQIDDGYQTAVGDWLSVSSKFPNGMKYIANTIKLNGNKAGIWISPFICEKKSYLFKNHKDWIVHDGDELQRAGYGSLWGGEYYSLNIYNHEFQEYLKKVFTVIIEVWGFEFIKLDFLYAAGIKPIENKTRAEIMYDALELIKEYTKGVETLGCGVPIAPALGKFDYCRIGSDMSTFWEDEAIKLCNFRERNSTINSLFNTIYRRHFNGYGFSNDPDVIMLRSIDNELNYAQRKTLLLINLVLGGMLFISDNIKLYDENERYQFLSIFPIREKVINSVKCDEEKCIIDFQCNEIHYLLVSNLSDNALKISIPNSNYFGWESEEYIESSVELQPYSSKCLVFVEKSYQIIGSSSCVIPGCDVNKVEFNENEITVNKNEINKNYGCIYIRVEKDKDCYMVNGNRIIKERDKDYIKCFI
jgi:alpha-galactosidase